MTRRMSRSTAIHYIVQMVGALSYAHQQSILHRDIKPENFVLFPDQTIRLSDFGLARIERGGHDVSASGTVGYMAPEQAKGKPVDRRADIWSFGVVLYEMLVGAQAFRGEDVSEVLASVLKLDIDTKTHPAWTGGDQKLMDRGGRVSRFKDKFKGFGV